MSEISQGIRQRGGAFINDFKSFIARGNVVDLAVGIIIGAAFTTIVNSLVKDIIMPPIGMLTGGVDFTDIYINMSGGDYPSLAAAQAAGAATINVGVFINAVINFMIVSFAVFVLIKQVQRFRRTEEAKPAAPPATKVLLTEIRDLLKEQRK